MDDKREIKMQMTYRKLSKYNKINEKTCNRLVRDKIPDTIKTDGRKCDTSIVAGDERYKLLEAKFQEEVNEFLKDKNLEELANLVEVLFGISDSLGYSEEELLKAIYKKREERMRFRKGIGLKTAK